MTPEKMAERCREAAEKAKAIMAECEKAGTDPTDALANLMGFLATDALRCGEFPAYDECRTAGDGHFEYDAPAFPPEEGGDFEESTRFFRFFCKARKETADRRKKFGGDLLMELSR